MALEIAYPHIEKKSGTPAFLRRVPRIRVAMLVMDYVFHGWSPEEMCRQHPYLLPSEAYAAMGYYYDHQEEIDQEISDELKLDEEIREKFTPSLFFLKMRSKGEI